VFAVLKSLWISLGIFVDDVGKTFSGYVDKNIFQSYPAFSPAYPHSYSH